MQGRLGRVQVWVTDPVLEKASEALRGRSAVSRAVAAEARAAPVRGDFEAGVPDQEAHLA
jgi:hypothetical protein